MNSNTASLNGADPGGGLRKEVASVVRDIVDEATTRYLGQLEPADLHWKDADQVVTPADLRIERKLIGALSQILPGGFMTEEAGHADAWRPGGVTWIIDPIDGSSQFAQSSAEFATTIALWRAGHAEAAWIYATATGEMWTAQRGHGWWLNDEPQRRYEAESGISITADRYISEHLHRIAAQLRANGERLVQCQTVSLAYTRLAKGKLEAAIYDWDKPWDHAAGVLLCTEAGLSARHVGGERYDASRRWSTPLLIAPHDRWDALARAVRLGGYDVE